MANLETFTDGSIWRNDHIMRPVLVLVLAMLAVAVFTLAACCVAIPVAVDRRRRASPPVGIWPFTFYFTGIGLGFLLVEVSQLQRLSTFLGHPTFGLTVVLASVLVFSGVGSMLTERLVRIERRSTLIAPLAALVVLLGVHGLVTPSILDAAASSTTPMRIATAVGILAPPALLMGMPLAIGMRVVRATPGAPAAFLLAVNGATSVCASVAGIAVALSFGISTAFWVGAAAYVLAILSMMAITRRRAGEAAPFSDPESRSLEPRDAGVLAARQ